MTEHYTTFVRAKCYCARIRIYARPGADRLGDRRHFLYIGMLTGERFDVTPIEDVRPHDFDRAWQLAYEETLEGQRPVRDVVPFVVDGPPLVAAPPVAWYSYRPGLFLADCFEGYSTRISIRVEVALLEEFDQRFETSTLLDFFGRQALALIDDLIAQGDAVRWNRLRLWPTDEDPQDVYARPWSGWPRRDRGEG